MSRTPCAASALAMLLAVPLLTAQAGEDAEQRARAALAHVRGLTVLGGERPGQPVHEVRLDLGTFTDRDLAPIAHFQHLRVLRAYHSAIDDSGFAFVRRLARLEKVDFHGVTIGDAGLKYFERLCELRVLRLDSERVSDAGLKYLEGLGQLRELSLSDARITDTGVKRLHDLTKLRVLDLANTKVTDAGIANLSAMTDLRRLDLQGTKVTRAGLKSLPAATQIRWVNVSRVRVGAGPTQTSWRHLSMDVRGGTARLSARAAGKRTVKQLTHHDDRTPHGFAMKITCWAFSPDGQLVVTGAGFVERLRSGDTDWGELRVWDTASGRLVATLTEDDKPFGAVQQVFFLPDGKTVVFESDDWELGG